MEREEDRVILLREADADAHAALDAALAELRRFAKEFPDVRHATCKATIELGGKQIEVKVGVVVPERSLTHDSSGNNCT